MFSEVSAHNLAHPVRINNETLELTYFDTENMCRLRNKRFFSSKVFAENLSLCNLNIFLHIEIHVQMAKRETLCLNSFGQKSLFLQPAHVSLYRILCAYDTLQDRVPFDFH